MPGRVVIAETDPRLRDALEAALSAAGYEVVCAGGLERTLRALTAAEGERERAASARPVVAASEAMIGLLETLERRAAASVPLLLLGEAGTGREALARVAHAQSPRRSGAFVPLDCRAEPPEALARSLFGGAPGSRAREASGAVFLAEEGTLFLDGIDALPAPLQAALLELLDTGTARPTGAEKARPVDLRLIATARAPLGDAVARGRFRPELSAHLAGSALRVPPLRERREDLPLLVDHYLARAAATLGRPEPGMNGDVLARLAAHAWPGNLRELESALLHAVLHAGSDTITLWDLPEEIARGDGAGSPQALKPARKRFEAEWIRRALGAARGNRTHAARLLGISHRSLLYKLKEYGVD